MIYELKPQFESVKSYYRKATVAIEGNKKTLISYDTKVCTIEGNNVKIDGFYSATTLRHIKEFLKQEGFKATTKNQLYNDYM
jgi:hypothetical protein